MDYFDLDTEVKNLINDYLYYTSEDVERDEEGNQALMDAKELIMDERGVDWGQATAEVSGLINEYRASALKLTGRVYI